MDIFQNEKRILFCSIFQYPLYPLSRIETININHIIKTPLPSGATGREFRAEIAMNWLEAIDEFKPELAAVEREAASHRLISALTTSASWQLTAPLRAAKRLIGPRR